MEEKAWWTGSMTGSEGTRRREVQATAGQAQMSVSCLHGFGTGKAAFSSTYCG